MFCEKCGNQVPDGAKFCAHCGNAFGPQEQPPVQEPVTQEPPVYQPPAYQPPVYQPPVSAPVGMGGRLTKKEYLSKNGSARTMSWISRILLFVGVILIGVCLYTTLYGDIRELPVMEVMSDMIGVDVLDFMDECEELAEDAEDKIQDLEKEADDKGGLSKDDEEALELAEETLDALMDLVKKPSIMTCKNLLSDVLGDDDVMDILDEADNEQLDDIKDDIEDLVDFMNIGVIVIIFSFAIAMLLNLLAGIFNNNVLVVFSLIFAVPMCCMAASVVLGLLLLVLYIAAMVLISMVNSGYRKNSCAY